MNRCVGLWTSRKRRWRQPSRKRESLDSPPRGRVGDRELADRELLLRGADHHLRRELHAGRTQVERRQDVAPESAHPAVRVAHAGAEEEVERSAEQRIADVAMHPVHRARLDVVHPVAHDELGAVAQLLDEPRDVGERIGHVGVEHHDVLAAGGAEAGEVGRAVAAARLVHDTRSGGGGELGAAVIGVVVGDDDLADDPRLVHRGTRAADALLDVLGLVEARDHHRDLHQRCGGPGFWERGWCAVCRGHDRVRAARAGEPSETTNARARTVLRSQGQPSGASDRQRSATISSQSAFTPTSRGQSAGSSRRTTSASSATGARKIAPAWRRLEM